MGRVMRRGQIWLAHVGRTERPVLLHTRTEVLDVRGMVTAAEITTSIRGLATEVAFDHDNVGVHSESVINCDGLHTIAQTSMTGPIGEVDDDVIASVCAALNYSLGY